MPGTRPTDNAIGKARTPPTGWLTRQLIPERDEPVTTNYNIYNGRFSSLNSFGVLAFTAMVLAMASAAQAQTYTVLHNFSGGTADGMTPWGSLIQSDNILYGMTYMGGESNAGTLFAFNTSNNTQSLLHSFGSGNDGSRPTGSLIQSGNVLYGMTEYGGNGPYGGYGTLFSLTVPEPATLSLLALGGLVLARRGRRS